MSIIGISIPTYKRENVLLELLKSIPPGFKISVSDNGSTISDKTIAEYKSIDFVKKENVVSMFENWNLAINNMSECDYIMIPSDDDLYYEDSYSKINDAIKEYPDSDIYIFGNNVIDENQNVLSSYLPSRKKVFNAPLGFLEFKYGVDARMPSIVFNKKFLDRIGYFDERFKFTAADSELIQRALLLGKSVFIPSIVSGYRVWAGGLTHQTIATENWMNEIDMWSSKIGSLAKSKLDEANINFNQKKYEDTLQAENLLVGLVMLFRRKKYEECIEHYNRCRYPKNAKLILQFKINIIVLFAKIKK